MLVSHMTSPRKRNASTNHGHQYGWTMDSQVAFSSPWIWDKVTSNPPPLCIKCWCPVKPDCRSGQIRAGNGQKEKMTAISVVCSQVEACLHFLTTSCSWHASFLSYIL